MCGLIGTFIKSSFGFSDREVELFQELLFVDTVRGMDSTGVCSVENTGEARVVKAATWAPSFISSKTFQELLKDQTKSGKILMGHNRKATVGKVVDENAHPFVVNNELVLMHNGSLNGHKHLGGDFDVDSEAIAHYIHANFDPTASAEEKAKVLEKLGGAWALVWYDLRCEKLFIVRNSQRPLNIIHHSGMWAYASDADMLKMCWNRNMTWTQNVVVRAVPTHTLLSFDGEELKEEQLPFFQQASAQKYTPTLSLATNVGDTEANPSKSQHKRTLKAILGKTIPVSVDDVVTIAGKQFWYGSVMVNKLSYEVTGWCDNTELLEKISSNYGFALGRVSGGKFDPHQKTSSFYVTLTGIDETAAVH